jgi:hypothetical protein
VLANLINFPTTNFITVRPSVTKWLRANKQKDGRTDREIELKGHIHATFVSNTSKMISVDLAVSRRHRNAEAGFDPKICGGQVGAWTSYPLVISVCDIIPPTLYSHFSLIYQRCYKIFAIESAVK